MAFDYKKEYPEYYLPPRKPVLTDVPEMRFVAVRGRGDPNAADGEYQQALSLLYAIAFTIKMSRLGDHRIEGYFAYVVPPLEGLWWQENAAGVDFSCKGNQIKVISGILDEAGGSGIRSSSEKKTGYVLASVFVPASASDDGIGLVKTTQTRASSQLEGCVNAKGGGMTIPKLYQFDYRTTLCCYGGVPRGVSSSGCNVTCVSMVVAYLVGNTNQTPEPMFDWTMDNGLYVGNGLGHRGMSRVAAHRGARIAGYPTTRGRLRRRFAGVPCDRAHGWRSVCRRGPLHRAARHDQGW